MTTPSEEISQNNTISSGKTDSNLANDTKHVGGIPAEDMATKQYVSEFHTAKENLLKEYINSHDESVLNEAKAYADTIVGNQDFSGFVEFTDLQALNANLQGKINECSTQCATNLNNAITSVVNDVNNNFNSVENSIDSLDARTNQLFQSVSNGKSTIAAAITDKGVDTASDASFSTMANNIRNIRTIVIGDGEDIDENFVNTYDSNATAQDIQQGKTAYVKGQKIYGTHIDLDTSDANATANDIELGKTAYVNGQKVYGLHTSLDTSDADATSADIMQGKSAYVDGEIVYGTHEDLDTSDANATANDIALNKTAYVNGQKIYGLHSDLDTSDANATADDIVLNKSAYVNGSKIYGTLVNIAEYPTYGTDTSDANASASDIAYGKTAYVDGQKLVGTANFVQVVGDGNGGSSATGGIQEIYGTMGDQYTIDKSNFATGTPPNGATAITGLGQTVFSFDGKYCVRVVTADDGNGSVLPYIESFAVNDSGNLTYQYTSGLTNEDITCKKYRYSLGDLGLPSNATIKSIALGASGLDGSSNKCVLSILYYIQSGSYYNYSIKFLTYHLSDNGAIGQMYSGEQIMDYTYNIGSLYYAYLLDICASPIIWNKFYVSQSIHSSSNAGTSVTRKLLSIVINIDTNYEYSVSSYESSSGVSISGSGGEYKGLKASKDGKYVFLDFYTHYSYNGTGYYTDYLGVWNVENSIPSNMSYIVASNPTYLDGLDKIAFSSTSGNVAQIIIATISSGSTAPIITTEKTITVTNSQSGNISITGMLATIDNDYLILASNYIYVLDLATILADSNSTLSVTTSIEHYMLGDGGTTRDYKWYFSTNLTGTIIYAVIYGTNKAMWSLLTTQDVTNLVAIVYKNKYFYNLEKYTVSALPSDVVSGKTFIGNNGTVETGTMGV